MKNDKINPPQDLNKRKSNRNGNGLRESQGEENERNPKHLSSYVQYLIVSPLTRSDKNPAHLRKRLCARIVVQNPMELSFVTLVADEDECPTSDDITNDISGSKTRNSFNVESAWNNENEVKRRKTKWRFNLTRTSKFILSLIVVFSLDDILSLNHMLED